LTLAHRGRSPRIDPAASVSPSAAILPPENQDEIWFIQRDLDFPGTVYGVERGTPMSELMYGQSTW